MTSVSWRAARNLLCLRLDTIGDVLMTGPALRALKESAPDRRITLLTSAPGAAVAALMEEIDETWVYEAPWMKRAGTPDPASDEGMIARLRHGRFDGAVIFTAYTQSALPAALLCHLSGIPLRAAHCRENPYGLLTDWVQESEPDQMVRHEVRRQLDLVRRLDAAAADERLRVETSAADRAAANALLAEAGIDHEQRWAVLHPGATAPSRRYPAELWASAARTLAAKHGVELIFTGDAGEAPDVDRLRGLAGGIGVSLAGRLSLGQLAAVIEASELLLCANSGPAHLAAAVGTQVVEVYALTNPQHTPWAVPSRVLFHDVPCRWCYASECPEDHHDCVRRVPAESIVEAALGALSGTSPPPVDLPAVPPRLPRRRGGSKP